MKKLVLALAAAVLTIGIAAVHLWMELRSEREQSAGLRAQVTELQAAQLAIALRPAPLPVTAPQPAPGTAGQPETAPAPTASAPQTPAERRRVLAAGISETLATPQGREMTRSILRTVLTQQYPDLAKKLNLTPEQAEKLLDLVADQQMAGAQDAIGLLAGGGQPDAAAMQEMQRKTQERQQKNNAEIAAMLGGKYPQFQEYQETLGSRQQVTRLRSALSSTDNPLREAQSEPLVAALAAEQARIDRETRDWTTSMAGRNPQERRAAQQERTAENNRRLAQTASAHLNSQQLDSYRKMQEQEANLQRLILSAQGNRQGQGAVQGAVVVPAIP